MTHRELWQYLLLGSALLVIWNGWLWLIDEWNGYSFAAGLGSGFVVTSLVLIVGKYHRD